MSNIRNFCIIAHIDHGKSTLADRMLEATGTVEARRMRPQYLDQLELERERGITIKMAPVRMKYHAQIRKSNIEIRNKPEIKNPNFQNDNFGLRASDFEFADSEYILNLIDTPGHSDFSYEVSRALAAVEGAILLVDITKGIQAQTLSNFRAAKKAGLTIIGAVNKIDLLPRARTDADRTEMHVEIEKVVQPLTELLQVPSGEILRVSGKTGEGVAELLEAVVKKIPLPQARINPRESTVVPARALIFDSLYDDHKGILAYVRIFDGTFRAGDNIELLAGKAKCKIKEIGYFMPELKTADTLVAGEIGYIATGIKEPSRVRIGDTILKSEIRNQKSEIAPEALPGYREPSPVVFISFYPDGQTKFEDMQRGFERLRLTDAALSFEPDANEALGRGLKAGFLGQLHFEITASRLEREFGLVFLTSFPSIAYRVQENGIMRTVRDAHEFPENPERILQPMIRIEILTPKEYLSQVMHLKNIFDFTADEIKNFGEHILVVGRMPLAELIRDFDDQLKSVSAGYGSFSYEMAGEEPADLLKLEILVVGEAVPALTRIVPRKDVEREGRATVERLKDLLPRQQFSQPIQARAEGRIIARETIPAMRKDVTGYLYGGDRSRKMKLWKKQKRGKEKLQMREGDATGKVRVPVEVFREILKKAPR